MRLQNTTQNFLQPLTLDSEQERQPTIELDKLIFLLHYLIIIPVVMLCFVFLMRFLRSKGVITVTESEQMIEDLNHMKNFHMISSPHFNEHNI